MRGERIKVNKTGVIVEGENHIIEEGSIEYYTIRNKNSTDSVITIDISDIQYYYYDNNSHSDSNIVEKEGMYGVLEYEGTSLQRNNYIMYYINNPHKRDNEHVAAFDFKPTRFVIDDYKNSLFELEIGVYNCQVEESTYDNDRARATAYRYSGVIDSINEEGNFVFNAVKLNGVKPTDAVFVSIAVDSDVSFSLDYIYEPTIGDFSKVVSVKGSDVIRLPPDDTDNNTDSSQMYYYEFKSGLRDLKISVSSLDVTGDTEVIFYESTCGGHDSKLVYFDYSGVELQNKEAPFEILFRGTSCQYVKYISTGDRSNYLELSFEYISSEAVAGAAVLGVIVGVCVILLVLFFLAGRYYIRFKGCCSSRAPKHSPGCEDAAVSSQSSQSEVETHTEVEKRRQRVKCCLYGRRELSQADVASTESEIL